VSCVGGDWGCVSCPRCEETPAVVRKGAGGAALGYLAGAATGNPLLGVALGSVGLGATATPSTTGDAIFGGVAGLVIGGLGGSLIGHAAIGAAGGAAVGAIAGYAYASKQPATTSGQ
jgi:hypothetical protein